jgi:integrase
MQLLQKINMKVPTMKIKIPKLCHHKGRNLGYTTNPRTKAVTYHGQWGLRETKSNYEKWLAEYLSATTQPESHQPSEDTTPAGEPMLADLVTAFMQWADGYYRNPKTNLPTSQHHVLRSAIRELKPWVESGMLCKDFTTKDLLAVRAAIIHRDIMPQSQFTPKKKLSISSVNILICKIRLCFKKGVEFGLVPINVFQALMCVQNLNWRTAPTLRNPAPIKPAETVSLEKIQSYLKPVYQVLMKVHRTTGMRVKELVEMRWSEITPEKNDPTLYCYQPATHKNSHRGQERKIFIHEDLIADMKAIRKKVWEKDFCWCSTGKGINAGYSGQMTSAAYYLAIKGAIRRYNRDNKTQIERFTPLQIRHLVGTEIRETDGIEAAAATLGHARLNTTEIYAEQSFTKAKERARIKPK